MNQSGMPKQKLVLALLWSGSFRLWCWCLPFLWTSLCAQTPEQARQQFLRGQYEEVIQIAQPKVESRRGADNWRFLLVKSLLTLGRYQEAYTNAMTGLAFRSASLDLPLLAREAALFQNDVDAANRILERLKVLIEQRSAFYQSEENLVPFGRALLLLGVEPRLVLENCFRRAQKLDPPPREAFLALGELGLEKHDFALAADAFRDGLKKYPNDPDLEFGLAKSFETSNREEMLLALKAALASNPRHIPSLLLMADHLIDAEQYEEAEKQLALALKVNPHRPEALAYRAVLAHLRNDPSREEQFRTDALKFWKTNPQVDYLIGLKLARKYRFEEAAAAQKRALAFDPEFLPARRELAEDLLRLGQDREGWDLARDVHQVDNYDVTAFNLVTLHDKLAAFQVLTNRDFIVRMSPLEAGLYGDRVLDLLGRAKNELAAKYGVGLNRTTTVEIFPDQRDFAVRTFGMPDNPGYLGVCFGPVVTANSPAAQAANPANWEAVLWHEFCHVITLSATKNRMPRWLSEGISVYEERQQNPAWGQTMNLAYRRMILDGELTPVGKLSSAFLTPKSPQHLQFAYYEAYRVVDFLVQRFGFNSLKAILNDLRQGDPINQTLAARTLPLAELEKQFNAFMLEEARNLAPGIDLDKPPADSDAISAWLKSHSENYHVTLQKARELMEARRWTEAKPLLQSLARAYHGERRADNPLWLLAVTERNLNDTNAERATLQEFAEQEADFVELYVRLIELSEARKDWLDMTGYAERLLAINPLISAPYRALAAAGIASGKNDQAIMAYRKCLMLDPPDPAQVHFELARLLHARGDPGSRAKRHALEALEEAPRFRDAQRLLLDLERSSTNNPPLTRQDTGS